MPSSYSVAASSTFNGSPDEVFDFLLFFFQQPPEARFRGEGLLTGSERVRSLKGGGKAATRWCYPSELVIEETAVGPFLKRHYLALEPAGAFSRVTWRWENESRNVLERLFVAIHRRQMGQADQQQQALIDRVNREYEWRHGGGVGQAFDEYRATLDKASSH